MHVATRLATYRPFLSEKTLENAKLVENPNNLAWFSKFFIQGHAKDLESFQRMSKNNVLSDETF